MRRRFLTFPPGVPLATLLATLPATAAAAPANTPPTKEEPAAEPDASGTAPPAGGAAGDTDSTPPEEVRRDYMAPTGIADPEAAEPEEPAEPQEVAGPDTGDTPANAPRPGEPVADEDAEPVASLDDEVDDELAGLLGEVVVGGASRTAESGADAPASVQVITGTELKTYGIRTLDEAFNYLSLGIVAESGGATGETGVRGVTMASDFGDHMLLVIDGHVVNDPASGIAWFDRLSGIAIDTIDRIELIYGPGGVLYGNNAILVVINIVTKKGADMAGFQVRVDGAVSPNQNRHGTLEALNRKQIGHRERVGLRYGRGFKFRKKDGELLLQGDFLHDKTPAWQLGPQYHPEFPDIFDFGNNTGSGDPTVWGGRASGQTRGPFASGKLRLGDFTLSGRSVWISLDDPTSALDFGPNGFNASIGSSYVDARYDYVVSQKVSGMARVYWDHLLYQQRLDFPGQLFCGTVPAPCALSVASEAMGFGLESQWNFDWLGDGRFLTLLGADGRGRTYTVRLKNIDNRGNEVWLDGNEDVVDGTVGAYLQQILRVHPRISINGGARYDYFTYAQAISPRGALVFNPWKGGALKLIYSQAFRAPSRTELSAVQDDEKLEPEVVRTLELSLGQRRGTHHVSVSAYAGVWEDLIQRAFVTDPNNPGRIDLLHHNANMLWQLGGSVGYDATLGRFSYGVGANYGWARVRLGGWGGGDVEYTEEELAALGFSSRATNKYGRNIPLGAAPPYSGNLRLAYSIGDNLPTVAFTGQLIGPRLIENVYSDPNLIELTSQGAGTKVPPKFTGRAIVTHDITRFQWGWLAYRFGIEATTNTDTPSTTGPFDAYTLDDNRTRRLQFQQVPRMTIFAGLTLGFDRKGALK